MSDTTLEKKTEAPKPAHVNILKDIQGQVYAATKRGLAFPPDFNLANAMASARTALITLGVIDINGAPTKTCSIASLVNAVYDMAVQGMNVGKKQGYFINYGGVLTFQRSYFGDIALAFRIIPELKVYAMVVCEGDKFVPYTKFTERGMITCVQPEYNPDGSFKRGHDMGWPRDVNKITACYVGATLYNQITGEVVDLGATLMTIDQIKTSWRKSKTYKPNGNTFHNEQPDQACLRTVSRRWSKPIINSSNDALLLDAITRQDLVAIEAEVAEDAAINANGETLSLPANEQQGTTPQEQPHVEERHVDPETGEVTDQPDF